MVYIKSIAYPPKLKEKDKVTFTFSDGSIITGVVNHSNSTGRYYICLNESTTNSLVFNKLCLDKRSFVQSVVGYSVEGSWPEVNTLEDLVKVLLALLCLKEQEKQEEKQEEKSVQSSEWSWLLG